MPQAVDAPCFRDLAHLQPIARSPRLASIAPAALRNAGFIIKVQVALVILGTRRVEAGAVEPHGLAQANGRHESVATARSLQRREGWLAVQQGPGCAAQEVDPCVERALANLVRTATAVYQAR